MCYMAGFKLFRRLVSLMLALVVLMSLVTVSASAEVTETDTYVLDRDANGNYLFQYQSPIAISYDLNDQYEGSTGIAIQAELYTMYNTRNNKHYPAYCTDINVTAHQGYDYRRYNLEDSAFAASSAGLIRAILTRGFYIIPIDGESDSAHKARVDEKVSSIAQACGVANLTAGEAIVATQAAIWRAAHGSVVTFPNFCRYMYSPTSGQVKYASLCSYSELKNRTNAEIASNVEKAYNYLISLDPISPSEKTVSPASFVETKDPVFTQNGDGTYDVTVTASVNVQMSSGDELTLKANLANAYTASASLSGGSQTKTLVIENVPADVVPNDVTLSISGYQTAKGFFYFDAKGDRGVSQNMVGYDNSQLPVYAEVLAQTDRVLSFVKTTRAENGRFPLSGIAFDIYFVGSMDEYRSGGIVLSKNPSRPSALPEYTVITDADGEASLNLTQHGLPDGVYLVAEQEHPSIVAPVAPFYVIVPMTNESGTGLDYQITIKPKNDIKGDVDVEKDVIEVGNDEASVDAAVPHTWIISTTVPHDIGTGDSFRITDTLDNRLDYIGNMKVMLETTNGSVAPVELAVNTDYTVTVNDVVSTTEDKPSDSFVVSLTKAGMSNIAALIGSNSTSYRLRVYFDAQLNANAEVGTDIPNKANVSYTNTFGFTFNDQSDVPVVNTGAANLLKVDGSNNEKVLPGAVFEVYRKATEEELAAGGENLVNIAGVAEKVVKVAFYNNAEMITDEESGKGIVTSVTTDENGKAAIYGLAYGEYYLVETQAPAGYNLLANATQITIDKTSHTEEMVVKIENKAGVVLPQTGGMGTTLFTASGLLLVGVACIIFMSKRKVYAR